MNQNGYKRPPIREAICQFHFGEPKWDPAWLGLFQAVVGDRFPARRVVGLPGRGVLQALLPHQSARYNFSNVEGTKIVSIAPGTLSAHVLAPYPGWDEFSELITVAVDAFLRVRNGDPQVHTATVRYINVIGIPPDREDKDEIELSDWFNNVPTPPGADEFRVHDLNVRWQGHVPDADVVSRLTLRTHPKDDDRNFWFLLDIGVSNTAPFPISGWQDVCNDLHEREKRIFESAITDRTRGIFDA